MQRLTGLDAAFLALETPSAHMQVMGVAVVDPTTSTAGPFSYERRARRCSKPGCTCAAVPAPASSRCRSACTCPIWIEDPDFDLDYHLRRAALPAPGGAHELAAFVADVAGRPLDRTRPLWEAWVVEGLEHGYHGVHRQDPPLADRRRVRRRDARRAVRPRARSATREAPTRAGVGAGARAERRRDARRTRSSSIAQRPVQDGKARVTNLVPGVVRAVAAGPRRDARRRAAAHRAAALDEPHDHAAPQGRVRVGAARRVKAVEERVRRHGERRRARGHRGRAAQLPRSARDELPDRVARRRRSPRRSAPRTSASSATGSRRCSRRCPSRSTNPLERVRRRRELDDGAKQVHEEVGSDTLEDWAEVAAPALFSRAIRLYGRLRLGERMRPAINLIVSNVPGPTFPLYLAGRPARRACTRWARSSTTAGST